MARTCRDCPGDVVERRDEVSGPGWGQSLTVNRCPRCGRVRLVRSQWHAGTGDDSFTVAPGETKRGYTFTRAEAARFKERSGG